VGLPGLVKYLAFLAIVAAALLLILAALRRGMLWTRPIQRVVMWVPLVGRALETLALARLTWVLRLTLDTPMDVCRALRLSLAATGNARYTDRIGVIQAQIAAGGSIHDAFRAADCFPIELLDALAVGEESGRLVESMGHLSHLYRDQARAALAALNAVAALAVYAAVMLVIVIMILSIAMFVVGAYSDALKPL
jgi:type IV pilus assembly protein PilC